MVFAQSFSMEFGGGYDAQLRLGLAVVLVEEFVGEVVWPAEEQVRVEGAELSKIDVTGRRSEAAAGRAYEGVCRGLTPAMRRTYSV
jgi:hypothetical protein